MRKKLMIGAVIAAVIIAAAGFGMNQALAVETVEIEGTTFMDSFREDGIVYASEERPVFTDIGGLVETVYVKNGDRVLVGDPILALETDQLKMQLQSIQGQIMSIEGQRTAETEKIKSPEIEAQKNAVSMAKNSMDKAKTDEERMTALYKTGAVSLSELESAQNLYKDASDRFSMETSRLNSLAAQNSVGQGTSVFYEGQLMQLQAQMDIIEDQIEKSVVRAEMDGLVSGFSVKEGSALQPLMQVAGILNSDLMSVESLVLAEDTLGLEVGQSVVLIRSRKGMEESIEGQITSIDPNATETVSALGLKERRVLVKVVPTEDFETALIPGSDIDVEFVAYSSENAMVVPKSAVFPTESGDAVWLIEEGKIVLQDIETGYEATRHIEVTSGLSQGDIVLKNFDTEGISVGVAVKSNNQH